MATVTVGIVLAAHGIRGACRCGYLTGFPERIPLRSRYLLRDPASNEIFPVTLESAQLSSREFVARFAELAQRGEAERLRGWLLEVPQEAIPADTAEGEYYYFQLAGLTVLDSEGRALGRVVNVIPGPAHELLEYEESGGSRRLLSFVRSIIAEVNLVEAYLRLTPAAAPGEAEP